MVDARENTMVSDYPGSGRRGHTSSSVGGTVLSCSGVLAVGGTSLSERGREAPKSLDALELIEASANMGRGECECVCQ